jgi:outer membrane receptor for ferrienterochelin and colicin
MNYSKNFEKAGSLIFIIFYKTSNQDIQPYSVLYPSFTVGNTLYKNVNVITQENVGIEQDLGFNLFTNIHWTDPLEWRTNISFYHRYTTNYINPGLNAQSWNYRINLNLTYSFDPYLNAEFSGSFNSARSEVQGHYPSFTNYILGLRKTFLGKKSSLAFIAGNFLNKNVDQPVSISGVDFITQNLRIIPYRTFGLNFSWKFGNLKFKKEKEEDSGGLENSPDGKP